MVINYKLHFTDFFFYGNWGIIDSAALLYWNQYKELLLNHLAGFIATITTRTKVDSWSPKSKLPNMESVAPLVADAPHKRQ